MTQEDARLNPFFDKNGKEIKEFAVLKVWHFKGVNEQGRGRKNYYMYKWVQLKEINGHFSWVALHLTDNSGSFYLLLAGANKDRVLIDTEIVQQYD